MRIALVAPPAVPVPPPCYGGTELIVALLCEELVALGHRVVLYASGDSSVRCALRARFDRARWPPDAAEDQEQATFAVADLRGEREPVDVVHAHTAAAVPLAGFWPAPLVYTVHHGPNERLEALYAGHPEVAYVAISRHQRGRLERLGRLAEVVPHGLDVARYPEGRPDRKRPYLAFLGRLSSCKGPDVAVDVAGAVGLPLRVAGRPHPEGPDEDARFRRDIAPRLGRPFVRRLGEVNHRQKVELLGGAQALLFPISWDEPFGLAAVEAMLCGCPVVAFPRGSMPELIDPGVTGFCVEDAREMAAVVSEKVPAFDRAACRERARERFGVGHMIQGYLGVYGRAIERWRGRRLVPAGADHPSAGDLG